jgi:hypothetical protein
MDCTYLTFIPYFKWHNALHAEIVNPIAALFENLKDESKNLHHPAFESN